MPNKHHHDNNDHGWRRKDHKVSLAEASAAAIAVPDSVIEETSPFNPNHPQIDKFYNRLAVRQKLLENTGRGTER